MLRLRSHPRSIVVYLVWVQQRLRNVKDNVSEDSDCLCSSVCQHRIDMLVCHLGVLAPYVLVRSYQALKQRQANLRLTCDRLSLVECEPLYGRTYPSVRIVGFANGLFNGNLAHGLIEEDSYGIQEKAVVGEVVPDMPRLSVPFLYRGMRIRRKLDPLQKAQVHPRLPRIFLCDFAPERPRVV